MTSAASLDELISELLAVAREQLRWQRAAVMPAVKESLLDLLETSAMRQAYELCDGSHTFREIASAVGVSVGTVAKWTRRWRDAGLAYEDSEGRVRHLVSIEALGIPLVGTDDTRRGPSRP